MADFTLAATSTASAMRKAWYAILVLGIAVCLTGAALMAFGEGLLGVEHTGIATVIGIVGTGIIGLAGTLLAGSYAMSSEKAKPSTGGV